MIKLKKLTAKRGLFALSVDSLELVPGECVAVLGNNGSGKSTFLSVLTGLLGYEGQYQLDQAEYKTYDLKAQNRIIGFLPQKTTLNMPFDVHYVVLTGRFPFTNGYHYQATDYQATDEIIDQFELNHLKSRPFNELSGGEKQRVLLARILNRESPVILLDEPLNGIDIKHQHEIIRLLKKVKKEKTILVVMHDLSLAVREFDRCLVFSEGKLVYEVDKKNIEVDKLAEIFGIKINTVTHEDIMYVSTELEK